MRRAAVFLALLLFSLPALADDWPQWFGPRRDGVWRETGLLAEFPKAGPTIKWRAPVHGGYSGPTVAAGKVYITDFALKPDVKRPPNPFKRITQPGVERVLCLDATTGKTLWTHAYDADYSISYSAGPRATPAVDGDRVYSLGAEGHLACLNAATGEKLWAKELSGELSPTPMWGFAGHPLVDGEKLICLTGGNDPGGEDAGGGHGVVTAFNKMTGALIWTALAAKEPGYSAPIIINSGGTRQLIVWDSVSINSLAPETGKVFWSIPFGPARMGLTVLTPRFYRDPEVGDVLMVATQYEGSLVLKLDPKEPKASVLWKRAGKSDRKTDALHSLISSPVIRDGHIYGVDVMGELRCLDLKTGDRLWASTDPTTADAGPQKWATAFLIPLGDTGHRYLIPNEHGDLILADLEPGGYREISRAHVIEPLNTDPGRPVIWCFPALAGGCVYWRNDQELICVSLRDESK